MNSFFSKSNLDNVRGSYSLKFLYKRWNTFTSHFRSVIFDASIREVIRLLVSLFSCDSVIFLCLPNTQCMTVTRKITNSSFAAHIIVWYFELACLLVRLAPFRRKDTKCRKSQIVFTHKHPKRLRSCSKHTRANVPAF